MSKAIFRMPAVVGVVAQKWGVRILAVLLLASAAAFVVISLTPSFLPDWFVAPSSMNIGSLLTISTVSSSSFDSTTPLATPPEYQLLLSDPPVISSEDFRGPEPFVYPTPTTALPPTPAPVLQPSSLSTVPADEYSRSGDLTPSPPNAKVPIALTKVDEELIYAKKEIEQAPIVFSDDELYAPLFYNLSVFKRSYELMEKILKVYIYEEGSRPIFHTPELKGIYASEGWFLKLMEENRRFVVKDPNRAHLFYLPYSSRKLRETMYVPNSHNMKPLLLFLKNYINQLSSKYPYWNRTSGSDHFMVACHDWGPYTTKWHDEFRKNTIKALCNADVSEGVFIRGKDVSLPETNIRMPKKPLRDIGGRRVSQRSILAFFAGNMHGRVRPILLDYWRGKDNDMKIYGPLPIEISRKMSYIQHMKSSKYCICPMGYEVNSPRIVEAIYYECVPVIIADHFVLPFEELLNWAEFSVVIAEKDIPRLKEILSGISLRRYVKMQANVKKLQKHFLWHSKPVKYDLFHMILHSIWYNRLNQIKFK